MIVVYTLYIHTYIYVNLHRYKGKHIYIYLTIYIHSTCMCTIYVEVFFGGALFTYALHLRRDLHAAHIITVQKLNNEETENITVEALM